MKKIIGAGGDPGGCRALIPVFAYFYESGIPFEICKHGSLDKEAPSHWPRIPPPAVDILQDVSVFNNADVRAFVFSSSINDNLALKMARLAGKNNIPVVHILDHWSNYMARLKSDGEKAFIPDLYTVMDQKAYNDAISDGLPASILRITGQPVFASLLDEHSRLSRKSGELKERYMLSNKERKLLIFVSEPVSSDQCDSPASPYYRGYTEIEVLEILCSTLQPFSSSIAVGVLPHPREDREKLESLLIKIRNKLDMRLFDVPNGRTGIFMADGVIGMASVLIYEAWLIGKPVLSLQPRVERKDLMFMKDRKLCTVISDPENMERLTVKWIKDIEHFSGEGKLGSDIMQHADAAKKIGSFILEL